MTVIVEHDHGCKWARPGAEAEIDSTGKVLGMKKAGAGHSDAAKRFSDSYNLHRAAGTGRGWIAVKYLDGSAEATVYETRAEAVRDRFPWDDEYFFCSLAEPSLTVCAAESLLRFKRIMSEIDRSHTDRDAPHGGLEVIPRLSREDMDNAIRAVQTGRGNLAMGYKKGNRR